MKPGLAKIIEKVLISRYSENSKTDHQMAADASSVDYVNTGWSKRVDCQRKSQSTNRRPTYIECENTVEFY